MSDHPFREWGARPFIVCTQYTTTVYTYVDTIFICDLDHVPDGFADYANLSDPDRPTDAQYGIVINYEYGLESAPGVDVPAKFYFLDSAQAALAVLSENLAVLYCDDEGVTRVVATRLEGLIEDDRKRYANALREANQSLLQERQIDLQDIA